MDNKMYIKTKGKMYAKEDSAEKGLLKGKEYIAVDCWLTVFCIRNSFNRFEAFTYEEFDQFFSREKPQELKKKFIGWSLQK